MTARPVFQTAPVMAPAATGLLDAGVPAAHASTVLTVDLDAVARNFRALREISRPARVACVVKADAYGLGAVPVVSRLAREGCDFFYVGHLEEALRLRESCGEPLRGVVLAVLNGLVPGAERVYADHAVTPVLNTLDEVARWRQTAPGHPAILHVDTGMNRLGLDGPSLDQAAGDARVLADLPLLAVISHLACADTPAHPQNAQQLARFRAALARLPAASASLANSGGTLSGRAYHFDAVRPGIALYGGNPFDGAANPMAPTVRLSARILQVRRIDKPEAVGYGATALAQGPRRLATIAAGYADGLPRSLSGRGAAYWRGVRLAILGRVSMDLITLDVTDAPEEAIVPGTIVDVIGPDQSVDALAGAAGTLGYELLTALGARYARRYIGA